VNQARNVIDSRHFVGNLQEKQRKEHRRKIIFRYLSTELYLPAGAGKQLPVADA